MPARFGYSNCFWSLALAQPNTPSSTILNNELNDSGFESASNHLHDGSAGLAAASLDLIRRDNANASIVARVLLAPTN